MNFIFLILVVLFGFALALPPTYDYFLFICNIGFCKKCAKLVTAKETRENRISRLGYNIFLLQSFKLLAWTYWYLSFLRSNC